MAPPPNDHSARGPRVAVVGHIEWVDFVSLSGYPPEGGIGHAQEWSARVGGGGGVAAAVLAEMGAEVDFFFALGRDANGEATVAELQERGVRPHVAWRTDMTRRAITYLTSGGERTIVTIGRRLEPRGEDELEWDRLADVDGVYFTAGDVGALRRARRAPVLTATPRGREALEAGDTTLDALIYSHEDADESAWARRLAGRAELMVATEGARGGRWFGDDEGTWAAVPAPGPARDAYGCGDSFAAAFTYGLADGRSVADAAALGAQRGAIALSRVGAP